MRSILNVKGTDKKRNTDIRNTTNEHCKIIKLKWAGHVARKGYR